MKSVLDCRRTGKGNYRHRLEDILLLVILDRLGRYITRSGIIRFGKRNLIIPVFGNTVEQCAVRTYTLPYFQTYWWWSPVLTVCLNYLLFSWWTCRFCEGIICIDGKAMRRTVLENGRNSDIVSGNIVAADTMSFQKAIIDKIRERGVISLSGWKSTRECCGTGLKTMSNLPSLWMSSEKRFYVLWTLPE